VLLGGCVQRAPEAFTKGPGRRRPEGAGKGTWCCCASEVDRVGGAARTEGADRESDWLEVGGSTASAGHKTVLFHPALPVDVRHNAKIFAEAGRRGGGAGGELKWYDRLI